MFFFSNEIEVENWFKLIQVYNSHFICSHQKCHPYTWNKTLKVIDLNMQIYQRNVSHQVCGTVFIIQLYVLSLEVSKFQIKWLQILHLEVISFRKMCYKNAVWGGNSILLMARTKFCHCWITLLLSTLKCDGMVFLPVHVSYTPLVMVHICLSVVSLWKNNSANKIVEMLLWCLLYLGKTFKRGGWMSLL